jgi:four helix bundle protein
MDKRVFQERTKQLTIQVIQVTGALPQSPAGQVIGKQIVRSATSVGANYRAVCRAKSTADMVNKLKIVEEEADETLFWLEIIIGANLLPEEQLKPLIKETNEILAMTVASIKTLRSRQS